MLRKIILGIAAFALISITVNAEGVGIIEAAEQAGLEIDCPDGVANCSNESDYSTAGIQIFILKILGGLLNFAALAAVLMLIVAGLRLVVAMGNQEQLQAAKKHILWILGGLAVIILSLLIVKNVTEMVYKSMLPPSEEDGLELQECLKLTPDGLLGPNTDKARNETPNLAAGFEGGDDCRADYIGKKISEMRLRESGEPACLAVKDFQTAFNKLTCNKKTGKMEDVAPPKYEVKIPESCYEGDPNGIQNEKFPGCDESVELQPICDQLEVEGDCTIEKVQKELKEYYDDQNANCSQEDGKYGQCTVEAIENYFEENDSVSEVAGTSSATPASAADDGDVSDTTIIDFSTDIGTSDDATTDDEVNAAVGDEIDEEEKTGCESDTAVCSVGENMNCSDLKGEEYVNLAFCNADCIWDDEFCERGVCDQVENGTVGEFPECKITCDGENYKLSDDEKTCEISSEAIERMLSVVPTTAKDEQTAAQELLDSDQDMIRLSNGDFLVKGTPQSNLPLARDIARSWAIEKMVGIAGSTSFSGSLQGLRTVKNSHSSTNGKYQSVIIMPATEAKKFWGES